MSLMQIFRDGPATREGLWRELWTAVFSLLTNVIALALIVCGIYEYHMGRYSEATLDAILVTWCLLWDVQRDLTKIVRRLR